MRPYLRWRFLWSIAFPGNLTELEFCVLIRAAGKQFAIPTLCDFTQFPQVMDDQAITEY